MFQIGDRVETTYKGKPLLGVVSSVGLDKTIMTVDGGLGRLTGGHDIFRQSAAPFEIPEGRAIRKGDRLEVTVKGGSLLLGVARKVTADKVWMSVDNSDNREVSGPPGVFRFSAAPLPVRLMEDAAVPFKKGDRLETTYKGKVVLGVARTVTASNVIFVLDGGKSELKGPSSLYRHSAAPLPMDPASHMDRWGIAAYKEYARLSEETVAFSATITLDGQAVMRAENTGKGGCNSYNRLPGAANTHIHQFTADVQKWASDCGCEKAFELDDDWMHWTINEKPYGVTSAAHFAARAAMMGGMHLMPEVDDGAAKPMAR